VLCRGHSPHHAPGTGGAERAGDELMLQLQGGERRLQLVCRDGEELVAQADGLPRLPVEPRVLQGGRRPAGQLLAHGQVIFIEGRLRLARGDGQHPGHPVPQQQRHRDEGARTEPLEDAKVPGALGRLPPELRAEVPEQHGTARLHRLHQRAVRARHVGEALPLLEPPPRVHVPVRAGQPPQRPVFPHDVDEARRREGSRRQVRHARQRCLQGQGLGQHPAGLGQEAQVVLGAPARRDVQDEGDALRAAAVEEGGPQQDGDAVAILNAMGNADGNSQPEGHARPSAASFRHGILENFREQSPLLAALAAPSGNSV